MKIYQEYLMRHQLDVPFVSYQKCSRALLKHKKEDNHYRFLDIKLSNSKYSPSVFTISIMSPLQNANERRFDRCFSFEQEEEACWGTYESYMIDLIKTLKRKYTVVNEDLAIFDRWKIFVSIHESAFVSFMDEKFVDNCCKSMDDSLSVSDRVNSLKIIYSILENHSLYDVWCRYDDFSRVQSEWIRVLFNG